jgi:hypothetical protein
MRGRAITSIIPACEMTDLAIKSARVPKPGCRADVWLLRVFSSPTRTRLVRNLAFSIEPFEGSRYLGGYNWGAVPSLRRQ